MKNDETYKYKITNALAKFLFDLPEEFSKAWTYKSVYDFDVWNIAFRPKIAKNYLEYNGSVIVERLLDNGDIKIKFGLDNQYQPIITSEEWLKNVFNILKR